LRAGFSAKIRQSEQDGHRIGCRKRLRSGRLRLTAATRNRRIGRPAKGHDRRLATSGLAGIAGRLLDK
jgi:hypothetical protein